MVCDWVTAQKAIEQLARNVAQDTAKKDLLRLCALGRLRARAFVTRIPDGMSLPLNPGKYEDLTSSFWLGDPVDIDWARGHAVKRQHSVSIYLDDLRFPLDAIESLAGKLDGTIETPEESKKDTRPVGGHAAPIARVTAILLRLAPNDLRRMKAIEIAEHLRREYKALGRPVPGQRNLERLAGDLRATVLQELETD